MGCSHTDSLISKPRQNIHQKLVNRQTNKQQAIPEVVITCLLQVKQVKQVMTTFGRKELGKNSYD